MERRTWELMGNGRVRLAVMAVRIFGRSPETMAEVRDAINARAFRRQAFREYLQAARPPWRRYEDW